MEAKQEDGVLKGAEKGPKNVREVAAASATSPVVTEVPTDEKGKDITESKSGTLEFIRPIGNPARIDRTTKEDKETGEKSQLFTSFIVGYEYKVLEDMEVPDCGLDERFKTDAMNFVNKDGKRAVKAGEIIRLTPFENALLLSPIQFNGKATGGKYPVTCIYQISQTRTKDGQLAKASEVNKVPRVAVKLIGKGSLKDIKIVDCLTVTTIPGPAGFVRKEKVIVEGFEKWNVLCTKTEPRTKGAGRTGAGSNKSKVNPHAQAFLKIVAGK